MTVLKDDFCSRIHLSTNPFNDGNGQGDFQRFVLPAVRHVVGDLPYCGLTEEKLKDKKPILIWI